MGRHHNTTIFFLLTPFFSRMVWLELFYWAASRHVPFIYRRRRMCRMCKETRPSPRLLLRGGLDEAGGRLGVGLVQHLTGERLVAMRSKSRRLAAWAVIAAWVIWADHRWIEAFVKNGLGPGWDGPGFCLGYNRRKVVVSWLQRPPTSMASTTSLQRRVWRTSGHVRS